MSACNTLTATNNCRYVPVPASLGSTVPMEQILAGPVCGSGCNGSVNSYTQTDTTINTQTSTNSVTETIGFSVKIGPPVFNATIATTMSWTDSESVGSINQTQNSIEYSLSSGTPLCSQDVLVYEDTIFHTFVTRQAPGNTSCP